MHGYHLGENGLWMKRKRFREFSSAVSSVRQREGNGKPSPRTVEFVIYIRRWLISPV
jgi:hypothetical protein